ncbi:MAG: hypothetical protein ABSF26_03855 [Thermoguttaceae bacterium]
MKCNSRGVAGGGIAAARRAVAPIVAGAPPAASQARVGRCDRASQASRSFPALSTLPAGHADNSGAPRATAGLSSSVSSTAGQAGSGAGAASGA